MKLLISLWDFQIIFLLEADLVFDWLMGKYDMSSFFLSLVYSKSYLFLEVTKVIWIFLFCFNHQYKIYSHASSWADEYAEKPSEQLLSISPEAFQTLAWNTWLETKTFVTMKEMFKCVFHVEAWHIISVYVRKIFK